MTENEIDDFQRKRGIVNSFLNIAIPTGIMLISIGIYYLFEDGFVGAFFAVTVVVIISVLGFIALVKVNKQMHMKGDLFDMLLIYVWWGLLVYLGNSIITIDYSTYVWEEPIYLAMFWFWITIYMLIGIAIMILHITYRISKPESYYCDKVLANREAQRKLKYEI